MQFENYPRLLIQGLCLRDSLTFSDLSDFTTIKLERLYDINLGAVMSADELLLIILNMGLTDRDITLCVRYAQELRGNL
jgi:hypothetical protein